MTDRYAVFGNPARHSKSPMIHGAYALATGQDMTYEVIEPPVDGFAAAVHAFRAAGGRGGNVTMPFKLEAFALATDRSERARLAGAANALRFEGDRIEAENFDGVGLVNDIQRNLGFALAGRRVLLLGAGGAARGLLLPFLEQNPALLVIANRTVAKAKALSEAFARFGNLVAGGYPDLGNQAFDLVVNATSASMHAELPPISRAAFAPGALAYDLVYGKGLTPFLRLARDAGAGRFADGVGMLVEQAAEGFAWWRGVRPETRPLIERLTVPLK
jgi:shikimate dehydrogenase